MNTDTKHPGTMAFVGPVGPPTIARWSRASENFKQKLKCPPFKAVTHPDIHQFQRWQVQKHKQLDRAKYLSMLGRHWHLHRRTHDTDKSPTLLTHLPSLNKPIMSHLIATEKNTVTKKDEDSLKCFHMNYRRWKKNAVEKKRMTWTEDYNNSVCPHKQ